MFKGLKSVNLKIIQMYHFQLRWKRYTKCRKDIQYAQIGRTPTFLGVGLPLFPVGLLLFTRWES